ncbi:hypothetical protein JCM15765_13080 [Paradesulfitobacterium aromaticivorans]
MSKSTSKNIDAGGWLKMYGALGGYGGGRGVGTGIIAIAILILIALGVIF